MKENLGFFYQGNGCSVCDRNRNENNDYLEVAYITEDGSQIRFYEYLSKDAKRSIEKYAVLTYRKHIKKPETSQEGIFSVIVKTTTKYTNYNRYEIRFDVQQWTPEMIDEKSYINSEKVVVNYVELFQPLVKGEGVVIELYECLKRNINSFVVKKGDMKADYFTKFTKALELYNSLADGDKTRSGLIPGKYYRCKVNLTNVELTLNLDKNEIFLLTGVSEDHFPSFIELEVQKIGTKQMVDIMISPFTEARIYQWFELIPEKTPATNVYCFFDYLWNFWTEEECKTLWGAEYVGYWIRWCNISKNREFGTAELFYKSLSPREREKLINRAVEVCNCPQTAFNI